MSCSVSERAAGAGAGAGGGGRRRGRAAGGGGGARNGPRPPAPTAPAPAHLAPPTEAGAYRLPRPCCSILWCCCCKCPCSNPNNKANDESDHTKNSNLEGEDHELPAPSSEEARNWGKSFDKLMKNPAGRKVFREFLKGEYSEENILFWLACEDLKKQTNKEVIEERARLVYEDYISILSPKEVSLDAAVREIVNRNMVEPTAHTFDEAQLQIYTLMHRDSYPRFVNSQIYKNLLCRYDQETEIARKDKEDGKDPIQQVASTTGKPPPTGRAPAPAIVAVASPEKGHRDQKNVG